MVPFAPCLLSLICNGCWACNKCVCVQLHSHQFIIQSDSLKKQEVTGDVEVPASRHSMTSAFTSYLWSKCLIWQSTQNVRNQVSSPPLQNCQESIMILLHSYNPTILDESLRGNFLAIPYNILWKRVCKNAFASVGLFSSSSTQSILTVGSLNNRTYRLPCTDTLHATWKQRIQRWKQKLERKKKSCLSSLKEFL